MTFAHAGENGTLATSLHGAFLGRSGVSSAFGAPDGDGGAARLVAGVGPRTVLGAHAGGFGGLGTAGELTGAALGTVRDAEASLDDAVGASCRRAGSFGGLLFRFGEGGGGHGVGVGKEGLGIETHVILSSVDGRWRRFWEIRELSRRDF
jgi:hypothetical protein